MPLLQPVHSDQGKATRVVSGVTYMFSFMMSVMDGFHNAGREVVMVVLIHFQAGCCTRQPNLALVFMFIWCYNMMVWRLAVNTAEKNSSIFSLI